MANKFNFAEVKKRIVQTKRELPKILAEEAVKAFEKNFQDGGFFGQKWDEVQRRTEGTNAYKYPKKRKLSRRTKPILTLSGRLRRAVTTSTRTKTWDLIKLVVETPYAQRHNEGLDGMPQRQFMADSPVLRKQQAETIKKYFDKVWL
jgi:phage gpG-like protein